MEYSSVYSFLLFVPYTLSANCAVYSKAFSILKICLSALRDTYCSIKHAKCSRLLNEMCCQPPLSLALSIWLKAAAATIYGNYSFKWPINLLSKLFVRQSSSSSDGKCIPRVNPLLLLLLLFFQHAAAPPRQIPIPPAISQFDSLHGKTILIWAFCFGKQRQPEEK